MLFPPGHQAHHPEERAIMVAPAKARILMGKTRNLPQAVSPGKKAPHAPQQAHPAHPESPRQKKVAVIPKKADKKLFPIFENVLIIQIKSLKSGRTVIPAAFFFFLALLSPNRSIK